MGRLRAVTAGNVGSPMVVIFDSRIVTAPVIRGEIGAGEVQLGIPAASMEEADEIVAAVRARWPSE